MVGPSMRFASGISAYTVRLANALATRHDVSVLLLRELLPRRLFPGRDRVGSHRSALRFDEPIRVFDGLDWYLAPTVVGAASFIRHARPDVVILPWWTGAVAHSEFVIALLNLIGPRAKVVLELHEIMDAIEDGRPLLRTYSSAMKSVLRRMSASFVVHSEAERTELLQRESIPPKRLFIVPHGTYDQFVLDSDASPATPGEVTYLFFGLVRPYKGAESLIDAFGMLPEEIARASRLIVAGETWEGHTEPRRRAEASPYADRIELIDRYLPDNEVAALFAASQIAVFPYLRSSQSGAVRVAFAHGMPVVASQVGGLGEACAEYEGALMVPPGDTNALAQALVDVRSLIGRRYPDPFPWSRTVDAYESVFQAMSLPRR